MTDPTDVDVLIVGSGIMGAGIARQVRDALPRASILMVDGGPVIGTRAGQHLHDTPEEDIYTAYNEAVSSGVQALYIREENTTDVGSQLADVTPGMYGLTAFREEASQLSGGAFVWNVGGMGAHWTAATPWPYGHEVFDFIEPGEWSSDLADARRLLHVDASPFGTSPAGEKMLAALDDVFGPLSDDGRHVQQMPMAISVDSSRDGHSALVRTGPNRIFPPLSLGGDDHFELRANTLCARVTHEGGRASGAELRNTVTAAVSGVTARVVIVCADAIRSPQVLWASGVRLPALGRYLNEHAFLTGRVTADLDRVGVELTDIPSLLPGEWAAGSYWLPQSGERQPFHGQIHDGPITALAIDPATGDLVDTDTVIGYTVGLSIYVPTEIVPGNRLEFSETEVDAVGMPRIRVHYAYTDADRALIEEGRRVQAVACGRLGDFVADRDSALLAPGSSLHYTGTVRMGAVDDGTSVCNTDARVWGFENLYVAGNGVIPTALACNSTLTGMITAVRAARAITETLAER